MAGGESGGVSWAVVGEWLRSGLIAIALALVFRWVVGEPFKIPSGSMEPTLHGHPGHLRGDRVFVNKHAYGLRFPLHGARVPFTDVFIQWPRARIWQGQDPERWDIVVFRNIDPDESARILVKRIVALPGEHVYIADGAVHINGEAVAPPGELAEQLNYLRKPSRYSAEPHRYAMATPASYERFAELDEERYESDPRYRAAYDEYAKYNIVPEGAYLLLGDNSPNSRDGRVWGWLPKENILGRVASVWWPPNHWRDFTGFSETWWWRALVALAGILLFWRLFLGRSARVHSTAPAAGLREGDHVHVDRFSYGPPIPFTSYRLPFGREPRRGELVLYRAGKDNDDWLMGRIAAAPGDVISFQDDKLYIAGRQDLVPASLRDRAFPGGEGRKPYGRSKRKQMTEVPANHWFILSEAEESAIDSRNFGWVRKNQLVGRVNAVWWPPTRWRRLRRS